ncbi:MAG: GNAT family N-acetyltransferase [Candidatus Aminicenantes bacterium]|nr:GNAT family N-acetyltransferase [Candidatus Aminicenantes bacterium]
MKIINLSDEHEKLFIHCLEDWSDDMKESGEHRTCWVKKMKNHGLGVKLALDDNGQVGGMIQYIPIEYSLAEGRDLYFIPCIWVHGHKEGRGNFQKKGMGKALLQTAEEDVQKRGAKGLVAWGLSLPFWMKASWYKKRGYKKVDKMGMQVLLWKPFEKDAESPKWIRPRKKPERIPGKVVVSAFVSGVCSVGGINYERAKNAAASFGEEVEFQGFDTSDREVFREWGLQDAVFIDGKNITTGPPLTYDKMLKKIAKRVKRL